MEAQAGVPAAKRFNVINQSTPNIEGIIHRASLPSNARNTVIYAPRGEFTACVESVTAGGKGTGVNRAFLLLFQSGARGRAARPSSLSSPPSRRRRGGRHCTRRCAAAVWRRSGRAARTTR
jgi:hypothetical protein